MTAVAEAGIPTSADLGRAALHRVLDGLSVHDLYEGEGAEIYASQTAADRSELPHVRRLARRLRGMPAGVCAVDLAAGDGRLTGALVGAGRPVHAVDTSSVLLDLLRRRFTGQSLVQPTAADMTTWTPEGQAGVVVLGAGSIRLLDADQRARLFRTVRSYLHPDGILSLGTMDTAPVARPVLIPWGTHPTTQGDCPVTFFSQRDDSGEWDVTGFLVTGPGPEAEARLYTSRVRRVPSDILASELCAAGFPTQAVSSMPAYVGGDPAARFTTITAAGPGVDLDGLPAAPPSLTQPPH